MMQLNIRRIYRDDHTSQPRLGLTLAEVDINETNGTEVSVSFLLVTAFWSICSIFIVCHILSAEGLPKNSMSVDRGNESFSMTPFASTEEHSRFVVLLDAQRQ